MPPTIVVRSSTRNSFNIKCGTGSSIRLSFHRDQSCAHYSLRRWRSGAPASTLISAGCLNARVAQLLATETGAGITLDGIRFWLNSAWEDAEGEERTRLLYATGSINPASAADMRDATDKLLDSFAPTTPYCSDWPLDVLDAMGPTSRDTWPTHATMCWDLPTVEGTEFRLGGWFDQQVTVTREVLSRTYWSLFSSVCRPNVVGSAHALLRDSPTEVNAKVLMDQFVLRTPTFVFPSIVAWDADAERATFRYSCFTTPSGAMLGWVAPMLFNAWNRVFTPGKHPTLRHNHHLSCLRQTDDSVGDDFDFLNISQRLLSHALPSRVDQLVAPTRAA
jgi:hypothetical protein